MADEKTMTDEEIVAAAQGAVDNVRGEATEEEIAAAIAEIAAERAGDGPRDGE